MKCYINTMVVKINGNRFCATMRICCLGKARFLGSRSNQTISITRLQSFDNPRKSRFFKRIIEFSGEFNTHCVPAP